MALEVNMAPELRIGRVARETLILRALREAAEDSE
jgi:hypothetical protein